MNNLLKAINLYCNSKYTYAKVFARLLLILSDFLIYFNISAIRYAISKEYLLKIPNAKIN